MLTKEVDYRVCKWLLGSMERDGVLTPDEMRLALKKLQEHFQPPFLEVDVADDEGSGKSCTARAAYARVSTDHENQESSLAAQMDYYRNKILKHAGWEFVEVFVDDGISGLSTKRREGFNRMVDSCLNGEINLVLTKSISRFAQNTVDTVTIIRKLKEKGIGVYFEKENIFTLDSKGEEIVTNATLVRQTLCDTTELEREKAALGQELAVLVEMTQNCIAENARIAQDQGEYQKRYNGLVERYETAKSRFDEVTEAIAERSAKSERLAGFIKTLRAQTEPVAEFDERLWGCMVDYVTAGVDGGMTVVFRDGTETRENMAQNRLKNSKHDD